MILAIFLLRLAWRFVLSRCWLCDEYYYYYYYSEERWGPKGYGKGGVFCIHAMFIDRLINGWDGRRTGVCVCVYIYTVCLLLFLLRTYLTLPTSLSKTLCCYNPFTTIPSEGMSKGGYINQSINQSIYPFAFFYHVNFSVWD